MLANDHTSCVYVPVATGLVSSLPPNTKYNKSNISSIHVHVHVHVMYIYNVQFMCICNKLNKFQLLLFLTVLDSFLPLGGFSDVNFELLLGDTSVVEVDFLL